MPHTMPNNPVTMDQPTRTDGRTRAVAWALVAACAWSGLGGCGLSERDEDLAIRGYRLAPTMVPDHERLAMPELRTLDTDRRARVTMLGQGETLDDRVE